MFSLVAVSARHACVVVGSEAEVVCWGANEVGQSDWHAPSESLPPTRTGQRIAFDGNLSRRPTLALGDLRTCVSVIDNIVCWGGVPPTPEILPITYEALLSVGLDDVCALTPSGPRCLREAPSDFRVPLLVGATRAQFTDSGLQIRAPYAQPGLLRDLPTFEMEIPASGRLQIYPWVIGPLHVCARDIEEANCVGRGDRGQLGTLYMPTDALEGTRTPTSIGEVSELCVGGHLGARWTPDGIAIEGPQGGHTCGVFRRPAADGMIWDVRCMGANDRGQLGDGTREDKNVFTRVEGLQLGFPGPVYCGGEFTCAHAMDGLYCWGDNRYGQLGVDPSVMEMSATPVRIDFASAFNTRRL